MDAARRLTGLHLVALVLLALPAAAQVGGFGHSVTSSETTAIYALSSGGPSVFTFTDDDGDDRPDAGEAVYVSQSVGSVEVGDVRIAYPAVGARGSIVALYDADIGDPRQSVDGNLAFLDERADGRFGRNDTLFLDLAETDAARVSVNDLVLDGPDAGTVVTNTHDSLNNGLLPLSASVLYAELDGSGAFAAGDGVYLDVDSDGRTSIPDVRFAGPGPSGAVLAPGDPDLTYTLDDANARTVVVYIDEDGDDVFNAHEPAFLSNGGDKILGGDVRLANPLTGVSGSIVRGGSADIGSPATTLSGDFQGSGVGTSGALNENSVLYFHPSTTGSSTVAASDIILSGPDAGKTGADAPDSTGASVSSVSGSVRYLDVDGDQTYTAGDIVYFDADGDALVGRGDVQLSGQTVAPAPVPPPVVTPPTTPPTTTPPSPPSGTDEQAREDAADAKESAEEARVAAEAAQETAEDAKDAATDAKTAADAAKDAAEDTQRSVDRLADQLQDEGDGGGVPGPGPVALVLGTALLVLVLRRR